MNEVRQIDSSRLNPLLLVPPRLGTPWTGVADQTPTYRIPRRSGEDVEVDLPLFWCDPPWGQVDYERADIIAWAVSLHGILVSAMQSELARPDRESKFYAGVSIAATADTEEVSAPPANRIVPYRPERYGLAATDFDGAKVIDVRLAMSRDASGRYAYSQRQLERWEATPAGRPVAGGGWVPAATFPPDVISLEHLAVKLNQLRWLSAEAAVMVSLTAHHLTADLPAVLAAKPDGIILRLDDNELDGLRMAELVLAARRLVDARQDRIAVWVAPGRVSADDAAKLVALGADAVAVDSWCEPIIEMARRQLTAASRMGYAAAITGDEEHLNEASEQVLSPPIERFNGLRWSMRAGGSIAAAGDADPPLLGSFDQQWADRLGIPRLG